jgi:uncharacterized membrane protein YgcG
MINLESINSELGAHENLPTASSNPGSSRSYRRSQQMKGHELIPSAKRIIHSLRDMGYDFEQAVADVVDNSVKANATEIHIDVQFDGDDSWVRIADNGTGMREDQIKEALRYGSQRKYTDDDLGKFGLGLKTASLSQCRRLSVASRHDSKHRDVHAYAWDLQHIGKTDRWEVLQLRKGGMLQMLVEPLDKSTGTVVLWENLDRMLGYRKPYGEAARKRLLQDCRRLEQHLGMVFHRFLSGQVKGRTFSITLNGNQVEAWDPFCPTEAKTIALKPERLAVNEDGIKGTVIIEPFILPKQDDFSSHEAFLRAGCDAWNQMQGFYIYRANRLIQAGGWSNLRTRDEHTKLARVAVSFMPAVDEAFKINVAKMRAQLPSSIREQVRTFLQPYLRQARSVYDRKAGGGGGTSGGGTGGGATGGGSTGGGSGTTGGGAGGRGGRTGGTKTSKLLSRDQWAREMMLVAKPKERAVVRAVLGRLKVRVK